MQQVTYEAEQVWLQYHLKTKLLHVAFSHNPLHFFFSKQTGILWQGPKGVLSMLSIKLVWVIPSHCQALGSQSI